ncbi:unnamed protein product [Rotaria magnacalcarata]|uniref:VCBS repeat-containing protein n=1 Tax=Rotaria magnacalcarata TaxID=392030 RepID=A0A815F793_9BILA|nr:unnamed protein product [Rotaria magnacalcarata]
MWQQPMSTATTKPTLLSQTTLRTYLTGTGPAEVAVADVNGDGKPDIIVANTNSNNTGVLLNIGNGTFSAQTTYLTGTSPGSVARGKEGNPGIRVFRENP